MCSHTFALLSASGAYEHLCIDAPGNHLPLARRLSDTIQSSTDDRQAHNAIVVKDRTTARIIGRRAFFSFYSPLQSYMLTLICPPTRAYMTPISLTLTAYAPY